MGSRVKAGDLTIAILLAVVIGVAVGLAAGFAARAFGWPTTFVGPLTGGLVSAGVVVFYQMRIRRGGGAPG